VTIKHYRDFSDMLDAVAAAGEYVVVHQRCCQWCWWRWD